MPPENNFDIRYKYENKSIKHQEKYKCYFYDFDVGDLFNKTRKAKITRGIIDTLNCELVFYIDVYQNTKNLVA